MELLILYFTLALGISFLCSILEAVLLSISPSFVEMHVGQNHPSAARLKKVKSDIDLSISAILTLNTIANTLGAAGVGAEASRIFGEEYMFVISGFLTIAILYISEIIPKTLGALYWKTLAIPASFFINLLIYVTYPFLMISNLITRVIKRGKQQKITREEILAFAEMGEKDGVVSEKESILIENLLEFKNYKIRDIMTPSTVLVTLQKDMCVNDALLVTGIETHSRIPIYGESLDDIVGVVFRNRILREKILKHDNTTMNDIKKPVFFISEGVPVFKALDLFIKRKEHLFIVHDSYGQTMGIVTLEDAIETLLGVEIMDELDKVEDLQEYAKEKMKQKNQKQNELK